MQSLFGSYLPFIFADGDAGGGMLCILFVLGFAGFVGYCCKRTPKGYVIESHGFTKVRRK